MLESGFNRKVWFLSSLTLRSDELGNSFHSFTTTYFVVGLDIIRWEKRDFNEELDCELYTKSLFMVCGREFNKKVIEKAVLMEGLVGEVWMGFGLVEEVWMGEF